MKISVAFTRGYEALPPGWRRAEWKRFERTFPRHNQPWTLAEDRRLLKAFMKRKAELSELPRGQRFMWWVTLAKPFGRTKEAVQARVAALRAGQRLVVTPTR